MLRTFESTDDHGLGPATWRFLMQYLTWTYLDEKATA